MEIVFPLVLEISVKAVSIVFANVRGRKDGLLMEDEVCIVSSALNVAQVETRG